MQIGAINSNYYVDPKNKKQLNFKKMIVDKSALQVVNNMSKVDRKEFNNIKKRLSKTKHWDMYLSGTSNKLRDFAVKFITKDKKRVITDAIYPFDKKDKTISIYSIVYGSENISRNIVEDLEFKSKKRADKIYNNYTKNMKDVINRGFNIRPIEFLRGKEIELKMLEESAKTLHQGEKTSCINTEISTNNFIGNDFSVKTK